MIEDIILAAYLFQTTVIIAEAGKWLPIPAWEQITVGYHHTAVTKISVRSVAHGIAELVICKRRVDQVVTSPDLSDGTCFKKLVPLKSGTF